MGVDLTFIRSGHVAYKRYGTATESSEKAISKTRINEVVSISHRMG